MFENNSGNNVFISIVFERELYSGYIGCMIMIDKRSPVYFERVSDKPTQVIHKLYVLRNHIYLE